MNLKSRNEERKPNAKNYPILVVRRQSRRGHEFLGQDFLALNGGPQFTFSPAISFFVNCETQQEVDELWEKLSDGGEKQRCGWLKDKCGVSRQIIPSVLGQMLQDNDGEKSKRVMTAMLQMDKIDIKVLKQAYEQR